MPRQITLTALPIISQEALRTLLDQFEDQTGIHVIDRFIEWENYRRETVNISLKRQHVDVSMVGMPVTSDLEGMNVLRPFSTQEILSLGGSNAFLPIRWQSGLRPGSPQVWAVPMALDVRVLGYWRDMVDQAGIDETHAFTTHSQIENTVHQLSERVMQYPWYMPRDFQLLHAASSWIWAEGGDIFTANGRRVIFHEKDALRGLNAFFNLAQFADPTLATESQDSLFYNRKIAVTVTTPAVLQAENDPRLGVVPLPGGSYTGGVDLVIWSQTTDELACLELVRFLTQPGILLRPTQFFSFLPVRLGELSNTINWPTLASRALAQAALKGRSYPCVPMVGLVEERLSLALGQILQDINNNTQTPIMDLIVARLEPLARRINLSLSQE